MTGSPAPRRACVGDYAKRSRSPTRSEHFETPRVLPGAREGPNHASIADDLRVLPRVDIGCPRPAPISGAVWRVFEVADEGFERRRGRVISSASPTQVASIRPFVAVFGLRAPEQSVRRGH